MPGKPSNKQPTNFFRRDDGAAVVSNGAGYNYMVGMWDRGTQIDGWLQFGDPPTEGGDGPTAPLVEMKGYIGDQWVWRFNDSVGFQVSANAGAFYKSIVDLAGNIGDETSDVYAHDVTAANDVTAGGNVVSSNDVEAAGAIKVAGVQVVAGQQADIEDATDAASAITQLNLALAALRAHGLIAATP